LTGTATTAGKTGTTAPPNSRVKVTLGAARLTIAGGTLGTSHLSGALRPMHTPPTTRLIRSTLILATLLTTVASGTGCVGAGQRVSNWYYGLTLKAQEKHELADIRQDTRVALAEQEREALRVEAERDVEAARLDTERRQLEAQFCQANQEALQRQVKRNLRETVESKVAFNVEQGLEVGELEVDVEALQKLIQEREQEAQKKPPEQEAQKKRPCSCCDQPCNCVSGWIRGLFPHCRN
jgi:hypothetical protein